MSLSLRQIDEAIDALLENAEQLVQEAELLLDAQHFARAHLLAHLAREELSKSMMLMATGHRVLSGVKIDWKRLMTRLRDHKAKLRLETVQQSFFMNSMGETEVSEILLKGVSGVASYRNEQKNAALYVGFDKGAVAKPSNLFDERRARRTLVLAGMLLKEQSFIRSSGGCFADMPPDRFNGNDFDKLSPEQLMDTLKKLGPVYKALLDKILNEKPES